MRIIFNKVKKIFIIRLLPVILILMSISPIQLNYVYADNSFTETPLQKMTFTPKQELGNRIASSKKKKDLLKGGKQKISTDLLQLVDDTFIPQGKTKQQLKDEMKVNRYYSLTTNPNTKVSSEIVYVYVHLNPRVDIYAVDSYVQQVKNRDAKNGIVVAWVDINNLENLASNNNVSSVQTVFKPKVNMGSTTTQGVATQNVDKVLSKFKQSGAGIKVGVISDGVDSIASAIASGNLPNDVSVLSNTEGGNEGIAMMEIIYDMAPGAKLYFHDCGADVVSFNSAIDDLVAAGCNIIVDDVSWYLEPFFEDGIIAQHVTDVINTKNIIYLSSAGNSARDHYQGTYVPTDNTNTNHKYPLYVKIPPGGIVTVILQWDDKFGSSANDYDLYLKDASTSVELDKSDSWQNGNGTNPLEALLYTNNTGKTIDGKIIVDNCDGLAQTKTVEIFVYRDNGTTSYLDNVTSADSVFGQAAAPGVLAVGAVDYNSPNTIRSYSSRGPTTIAYPIATQRIKPDICGVDGVSVSGAGGFYNPFYGTSAAAPDVAAIAALLWAEFPQKTGNEIRDLLKANAKDLGAIGVDTTYGYGISDAMKVFMATIADHSFTTSIRKNSSLPVVINSSGDATNQIWFAPSGTTTFAQGQTMTKATGDATSISTPTVSGTYNLYLVVDDVVSSPSNATLTVDNSAPIVINSLILANANGVQLSSLTASQTVYITSAITGYLAGSKAIVAVYDSNKLIQTNIMDYNGDGTYKTSFALPQSFGKVSCKVFVFKDFTTLRPLTANKELKFSTYPVTLQ